MSVIGVLWMRLSGPRPGGAGSSPGCLVSPAPPVSPPCPPGPGPRGGGRPARGRRGPRRARGRGGGLVARGLLGHRAARLGEVARGEREPRDEADALLLAVLEDVLGLAGREVVEVLDRRDLEDLLGGLDLLDGDLGEAEVADEALVLHLLHDPE